MERTLSLSPIGVGEGDDGPATGWLPWLIAALRCDARALGSRKSTSKSIALRLCARSCGALSTCRGQRRVPRVVGDPSRVPAAAASTRAHWTYLIPPEAALNSPEAPRPPALRARDMTLACLLSTAFGGLSLRVTAAARQGASPALRHAATPSPAAAAAHRLFSTSNVCCKTTMQTIRRAWRSLLLADAHCAPGNPRSPKIRGTSASKSRFLGGNPALKVCHRSALLF